ncbi:MAG: L,D-transpeptidase [Gammaproteobacteria bacterium]|nr:L,D-transpeptidase [Gammaproteobacteria bacterium]
MVAIILRLVLLLCIFMNTVAHARSTHSLYYGSRLCEDTTKYSCYVAKRGDRWEKLFPDEDKMNLEKHINRINIRLEPGMVLAIPRGDDLDIMSYSPFTKQISPLGEKVIIVSLTNLAWGAYDEQGTLVRWGPASGARGYCPDIHGGCHTPTGSFAIYRKLGDECVSSKFPVGRGGAPMPYCMYFHGGFALHGSYEVPGYNASHGCVRLFVGDAEWLNETFTDIGTRVYVTK